MAYYVCMSVKNAVMVTPGSVKEKCSECDELIWVAPSAMKIRKENNCQTVCESCILKADLPEDVEIASPTKEQLAELNDRGLN